MAINDLLTLDEAKRALNIPTSDDSNDTELAQVITAASAFVDSVYGPVVERTVTDERHIATGRTIFLHHHPVASITTVTEYAGGTGTVLTAESDEAAGDYYLDASLHAITRTSGFSDSMFSGRRVTITYSAGRYANTESVAAHFKEAAVAALVHFWQHRGSQSGFGTPGGDGTPFGGVPFSTAQLRRKLESMFPEEARGPAIA